MERTERRGEARTGESLLHAAKWELSKFLDAAKLCVFVFEERLEDRGSELLVWGMWVGLELGPLVRDTPTYQKTRIDLPSCSWLTVVVAVMVDISPSRLKYIKKNEADGSIFGYCQCFDMFRVCTIFCEFGGTRSLPSHPHGVIIPFQRVSTMSHNLNFGAYRVGNAYVVSPGYKRADCTNSKFIYDFGPFDCGRDSSEYVIRKTIPIDQTLNAEPGHVYAFKGKMYVFITNAVREIKEVATALMSTAQRIPEFLMDTTDAGRVAVERRSRWIGEPDPLNDAMARIGIDASRSDPLRACAKSYTTTRYRGAFLVGGEESVSGRTECIHVRTQTYAEPCPSLQMRERTLAGVRYRRKASNFVCNGSSHSDETQSGALGPA